MMAQQDQASCGATDKNRPTQNLKIFYLMFYYAQIVTKIFGDPKLWSDIDINF